MKKVNLLLVFILTAALLCQCEKDPPKINIPDPNFLNALIELGVDTNGDNKISKAEAERVNSLGISGRNISDLTGIKVFINLDTLVCSNNQLTTLDITNNLLLDKLNCGDNQLTTINISNNSALTWIGFMNMFTLGKVCVWEMPFPPSGVHLLTTGNPNIYYTTDCN